MSNIIGEFWYIRQSDHLETATAAQWIALVEMTATDGSNDCGILQTSCAGVELDVAISLSKQQV